MIIIIMLSNYNYDQNKIVVIVKIKNATLTAASAFNKRQIKYLLLYIYCDLIKMRSLKGKKVAANGCNNDSITKSVK